MSDELLSGLKILVAVAKADGVIHDNERLAIESALETLDLPEKATADSLLAMDIDLDAELAAVKSSAVKRQTFDSACALAYVDGEASEVERAMLEKIRSAFSITGEGTDQVATSSRVNSALDRAFAPLAGEDAFTKRDLAVDDEIRRFSVLGAALAASSLPAFCEGIDVWNDVRLARKIGTFYGRGGAGDAQYWKTFVNNIVGSAGSWFAVSLFARLMSSASRTAGAYASTYAIGKVTRLYFEKSESVDTDVLRKEFKNAKKEGAALAQEATVKSLIEAKKGEVEKLKATLDADLAQKKISDGDYMQKLVVLD